MNWKHSLPTQSNAKQIAMMMRLFHTMTYAEQQEAIRHTRDLAESVVAEIEILRREIAALRDQIAVMLAASPQVPHPGGNLE